MEFTSEDLNLYTKWKYNLSDPLCSAKQGDLIPFLNTICIGWRNWKCLKIDPLCTPPAYNVFTRKRRTSKAGRSFQSHPGEGRGFLKMTDKGEKNIFSTNTDMLQEDKSYRFEVKNKTKRMSAIKSLHQCPHPRRCSYQECKCFSSTSGPSSPTKGIEERQTSYL